MSIDASASRWDSSVAYSLYSDACVVGAAPPFCDSFTKRSPSTRATSAWVASSAMLLAHHRVVLQGLAVARGAGHVLAQQVEALLDGREGEHGEALEVERLGDVLEAVVELAHDVVVGHEHVVEVHLVGALVAHGPDGVDGDAGLVEGHEEQA